MTVRTVLRLFGRLRTFRLAIPNAPALAYLVTGMVREKLQRWLPDPFSCDPRELRRAWRGLLHRKVALTEGAEYVATCLTRFKGWAHGRPWDETDTRHVVMDASPTGVGARVSGLPPVAIRWPERWRHQLEGRQSWREAMAAQLVFAPEVYGSRLAGSRVVVVNDNKGCVSTWTHCMAGTLSVAVVTAWRLCIDQGIEVVKGSWVPGTELVRRGVDELSRWSDINDWGVTDATWRRLQQWVPRMAVDRFASASNVRLRRWNSRFLGAGAEAVDALMQDWRSDCNYACPSLSMVGQVLELVRSQRAETVLVLPEWKGQLCR